MPDEQKGITISMKNLSVWITIAIIAISSIVDSALTRDQVRRNSDELAKYDLAIMKTDQKNMAADIVEIKEGIKALLEK